MTWAQVAGVAAGTFLGRAMWDLGAWALRARRRAQRKLDRRHAAAPAGRI